MQPESCRETREIGTVSVPFTLTSAEPGLRLRRNLHAVSPRPSAGARGSHGLPRILSEEHGDSTSQGTWKPLKLPTRGPCGLTARSHARLEHCSDPPRELPSPLRTELPNQQPGRDAVQVRGAAKCQDQHHHIHLPHRTGQASNQDALGLAAQNARCQSEAFLWPLPSQMEGSWVTACSQASGQSPARPWNILNVPQQRPSWPLVRTVCIAAHPAGLLASPANRGGKLLLSAAGVKLHTDTPPCPPGGSGWGQTDRARRQQPSCQSSNLVSELDLSHP